MSVLERPATLTPCNNHYHVELRQGPAQTTGGVWLPDNWRDNWTDAKVIAVGPGLNLGGCWSDGVMGDGVIRLMSDGVMGDGVSDKGKDRADSDFAGSPHHSLTSSPHHSSAPHSLRSTMWAEVGDIVLFQKHQLAPFGEGHRIGVVRDHDLIAMIPKGTSGVLPLNDWVKVRQDPEIERDGVVVLADEWRPRPMHGAIEGYGPGEFRTHGKLYGTRKSVFDIMGLPRDMVLEGLTVYWPRECEVLACGREALEFLLVQAKDLYGYEER